MSRIKSRQILDICGDCGGDATWVSINKGILLCTQCCSVHRSLGRHISQVKSLKNKSFWRPNQLTLVYALNNNCANHIWEYVLLENGNKLIKKKPSPEDSLQFKEEFIKEKHQKFAYAFRENFEDGFLSVENELGKQLHASVRTANLETSFRLLTLGADANYFHNEKGTTPLHVAVKFEQKLQVELLLVYGADPTYPDAEGRTPIDYAKSLADTELFDRLIESEYEVTDTLTYYLSRQKPEHKSGVHFLVPQIGYQSSATSLNKLQKLPDRLFEDLVLDVFEEVERREIEAMWVSCGDTTNLTDVPFLAVDDNFSTTRNQSRQKLGTFSTPELKILIYDLLVDIQRRQCIDNNQDNNSIVIDDDPLYDSVPSDDDYAVPPPEEDCSSSFSTKKPPKENSQEDIFYPNGSIKSTTDVQRLTYALETSDSIIKSLQNEMNRLKDNLQKIEQENFELKHRLSQISNNGNSKKNYETFLDDVNDADWRQKRKFKRPSSMFETRVGLNKVSNWQAIKKELKHEQNVNIREIIMQCTEHITRDIQQLVQSMQSDSKNDCTACANQISLSINQLEKCLSESSESDILKSMLEQSAKLKDECLSFEMAHTSGEQEIEDKHYNNIRDIAFHLAKFTKEIVTRYSTNH